MLMEEIVIGKKHILKANLFTNWELPGKNYGNFKTKTNNRIGKILQNEHVVPLRFVLVCELLHLATENQLCYI